MIEAVARVRRELKGRVPLIGFAGSPWTVATYMVEGGSSKTFGVIKRMMYESPRQLHRLLDLLARYLDSKGTSVVLGSEDALTNDPRLSAVLTSYGTGETLTGMLGVIGPARREYPRVIPVVELLGRALSDRLERREHRDRDGSTE